MKNVKNAKRILLTISIAMLLMLLPNLRATSLAADEPAASAQGAEPAPPSAPPTAPGMMGGNGMMGGKGMMGDEMMQRGMMDGGPCMDSKTRGQMMQIRGKMMKQMGELMEKRGKELEQSK